jgi:hypothetical protein
MASEILFTEEGTLEFQGNALRVGVTTNVTFTSKVKGVGNFPSGDNQGKGEITLNPDGTFKARYEGTLTTARGQRFDWKSREKSKKEDSGKFRGGEKVTGFQQYPSIYMDTETLPDKRFINTAYEL